MIKKIEMLKCVSIFFYFGWGTWIRTKELSGSEPDALPLGYTPIMGLV